jgi:hypothetical protein
MKKTLDDYLNDPDLVNEPFALREVHAIRLMIYDETKDMTAVEKTAYYRERAARFFSTDNSRPSEPFVHNQTGEEI